MATRAAWRAGVSPVPIVAAAVSTIAKTNVQTFGVNDQVSVSDAPDESATLIPQLATSQPVSVPMSDSSAPSTRNCRTILARLAPSASRTATSRRRADARAISRPATFAPAMSRTSIAAVARTSVAVPSLVRRKRGLKSVTRATHGARGCRFSGYSRSMAAATAASRARAWASETSSRSRPMACSPHQVVRSTSRVLPASSCGSVHIGSQRSGRYGLPSGVRTPVNAAGSTPTMVKGLKFSSMVCPRIAGSRLKRRAQKPSLTTAVAVPIGGRSSSGPNVRPMAARTCSVAK